MNSSYKTLENWIKENHKYAQHLLRTVFWLEKIYPQADEAMKIAALVHDIERAVPMREGENMPAKNLGWRDFENKEQLLWHGNRSAEIAGEMLEKENVGVEMLGKIKDLVKFHEIGGDVEKDAIKDADSISFLETVAGSFFDRIKTGELTKKEVETKFNFMLNRISSSRARELAEPFYNQAIEKLNKI